MPPREAMDTAMEDSLTVSIGEETQGMERAAEFGGEVDEIGWEVEGQKVTWLTPHVLQQVFPKDVDYKIMLTFLEFYVVIVY